MKTFELGKNLSYLYKLKIEKKTSFYIAIFKNHSKRTTFQNIIKIKKYLRTKNIKKKYFLILGYIIKNTEKI